MAFAVELLMDKKAEAVVRGIWREMAEAGISSWLVDAGANPHVTLAIYDKLELPRARERLAGLAKHVAPFPFSLASVGVFPTAEGVVFLGASVTEELLALNEKCRQALDEVGTGAWVLYSLGQWVPHCTAAMDLPGDALARAIEVCRHASFPIQGRFEGLSVVEFRPVHLHFTYALGE